MHAEALLIDPRYDAAAGEAYGISDSEAQAAVKNILGQGENAVVEDTESVFYNFSDKKWQIRMHEISNTKQDIEIMKVYNPIIIPRNHIVENALDEACIGNINLFNELLKVISNPYKQKNNLDKFIKPPKKDFEENYKTFCGT